MPTNKLHIKGQDQHVHLIRRYEHYCAYVGEFQSHGREQVMLIIS